MTTIGKILVIINFIFSLVTGFMIIMVFAVSTNWESSFRKLKGYYDVSQANVKTLAIETSQLRIDRENDLANHKTERGKLEGRLKDAEAANTKLNNDMADKDTQIKLNAESTKNTTEELKRVRSELEQEQVKVKDRDKQVIELVVKNKDLLDKSIRAEIAVHSFKDRAERLASSYETVVKELDRYKNPSGPARGLAERKPPPEDVNGIVKNSDARSGLATLSIGSDAGLSKGNTLFVYRLSPKPLYLGEIRILEVNPHEAVGRPQMAQRGTQLQAGDIVASQIMGQR
jgi:hypothetical protein